MPTNYDEWKEALRNELNAGDNSNWRLGELLVQGRDLGEEFAQGVSELGISPPRAMALMFTHEHVPPAVRLGPPVKWSHHRAIAGLKTDDEKLLWLEAVRDNDWSVQELNTELRLAGLVKPRKEKPVKRCPKCGEEI